MKTQLILLVITFLVLHESGHSQDSTWQRSYDFAIHNNFDLRNSSTNMIGAYRLINDGFDKAVVSRMGPKIGNVSKALFNFATVYLTMLWSHELGHSLRARQVGGKFHIHNFGLPFPYTTVTLPPDISLEDEAIFVTAGFEVNYLNVRHLQRQFISQNGLWNTDLALSFANRLMYPIYTTFVTPIDPKEREVWIETAGDPVHYILPVFKNYSDKQVFLADSTVNPELVSFYNQATIFGSFFQLLDPQFYREVGAAFGKSSKVRRPIFLIGDHVNGWTYGTLFNASPLGYELYFQNYIHIKGMQFGLYAKYGRPFKNLGLGLFMNNVIERSKLQMDLSVDIWEQDLYGTGFAIESHTRYRPFDQFGISLYLGYKTQGYVLGKQLEAGPNLGFGITYYHAGRN